MKQSLTKAEEEIMQYIWSIEPCTVSQILEKMTDKPPHSTVSSVARILEKKGFVEHTAYGRTYVYSSVVKRAAYVKGNIDSLAHSYFGGSVKQLISFIAKKDDIDLNDVSELLKNMNDE